MKRTVIEIAEELSEVVTTRKVLEKREKQLKEAFLATGEKSCVTPSGAKVCVTERHNLDITEAVVEELKRRHLFSRVVEERVSIPKLRALMAENGGQELSQWIPFTIIEAVEVK